MKMKNRRENSESKRTKERDKTNKEERYALIQWATIPLQIPIF